MVLLHTNYSSGNSGRLYIVIHYTGNESDSAAGNANYFKNKNRGASAYLFVDKSNVYEVVSLNNTAWAVGVNYGGNLFGICTNRNSISIELKV
ncbi:MAG TPA: N-acetylmuramoyl-L-alanine amidase [Candidatus Blautia merdipullorum]|nr:N-acetylmuramoyl-L-alanine amidase [Candidatus Blautia merdipullorum]